jgi:murein DD-endopeptidase MepM/ murein hydrolase activator NlpD
MTFSRQNKIYILLGLLLVTACTPPDPARVQVTMMGTKGIAQGNQMAARVGDNLEKIAQSANIDIGDILALNGLVPAGTLQPGQRLTTPLPSEITVLEGDSIDTITRAFGIDKAQFASLNNLQYPYALTRGQILKIPQGAIQSTAQDNSNSSSIMPQVTDHTVVQSDLPPVTSGPIETKEIASGQKVHSSASGVITEQDIAPPTNAKQAPDKPMLLTQPTQTASPIPLSAPAPAPAPQKISSIAPTTPLPTTAPQFSWPLNGSILSDFGSKADGQKNDGLDIGAPQGTSVRAAAMGDVVYVGDNVAGFGNLILIRHGGGYATAYGHVQNPLVKRGDRVALGQAIAQVGKSGNAVTPQLHFEVRKGTQAVNPETYLN